MARRSLWLRIDPVMGHWFLLLILFNFIDAITTAQLIAAFDITVEVNPFMRWIIQHYGNAGMLGFKVFSIGLLYLLSKFTKSRSIAVGLVMCVVLYGVLVVHNLVLVGYAVWFV